MFETYALGETFQTNKVTERFKIKGTFFKPFGSTVPNRLQRDDVLRVFEKALHSELQEINIEIEADRSHLLYADSADDINLLRILFGAFKGRSMILKKAKFDSIDSMLLSDNLKLKDLFSW